MLKYSRARPTGRPSPASSLPYPIPTTKPNNSKPRNRTAIFIAMVLGFMLIYQLVNSSTYPPPAAVAENEVEIPTETLPEEMVIVDSFASDTSTIKPTVAPTTTTITIVTGTHTSSSILLVDERKQHPQCEALANAIHLLWAAWEVQPYIVVKTTIKDLLRAMAHQNLNCVLTGSRKYNMLWTFPLTWRPDMSCDSKTRYSLNTKSYMKEKTKVYVNWFLLRPDLPTLAHMVGAVDGIQVRFAVSIGSQIHTAAFSNELLCPRIATILDKRDVYKQRYLLVLASDIQLQVERMKNQQVTIVVQDQCELPQHNLFSQWTQGVTAVAACLPPRQVNHETKNHQASLWHMQLFAQRSAIPKTVFNTPRLVFVAGIEGVGHHVFAVLGRKHTTRDLYESLTDHLCDSAWDDDSVNKYAVAREKLVLSMRKLLQEPQEDNVVFLNTVYVERDVNMYSYPWGGPRCYLKRYARVLCNIDLIELAQIAEEAGIDFRVVFLKRSIGAAVVSASLHRPFGTLVSETRMLALSWALLKSSVEAIDRRFVLEITYEDMINKPEESTAVLGEFIGFSRGSKLYDHFLSTLTLSNLEHPVGDGMAWKEEVDVSQYLFMSDLLAL